MTYLNAITYYLPSGRLTNEDINRDFPEWSIDKISSKTGIKERRIAAKDEFSSDLAVAAAERLFAENAAVKREEIDFVLLCTQSPDYFLPSTACIVQDRLGLATSCGALDFNLGCSGYVYGLGLAKGLVASGQAKNVLLLTAETYSKFVGASDKSSKTIFGDGASASLISEKPVGFSIGDFQYGTDGSGYDKLIVKEGGMRYRESSNEEVTDSYGNQRTEADLQMDGQAVFVFTIGSVPRLIRDTLRKNELPQDAVDLFVFHQANRFMLEHLRKKIKIEPDKFVIAMENTGNTVSATIPIALTTAMTEDRVKKDARVLLAGFGVGLSVAGCILTKVGTV
ncbi:3-oxoacyl-ACP synthase III family protein [Neolewinella antarctica]|uniref:3-oxoacyl-[acyl-carrier-protein] synthase-3 n=1 Tax=Neolewinella antarctica TaxID=442734 RepID=A0ABX0XB15_9BACT|nr:ketoacyl-ACP synthase III [Neolewinella antarctica]NJC26128.1 3-oxoacyl-[acyl-carrier-protein] synthase-3 [Neolewinella antarctica]